MHVNGCRINHRQGRSQELYIKGAKWALPLLRGGHMSKFGHSSIFFYVIHRGVLAKFSSLGGPWPWLAPLAPSLTIATCDIFSKYFGVFTISARSQKHHLPNRVLGNVWKSVLPFIKSPSLINFSIRESGILPSWDDFGMVCWKFSILDDIWVKVIGFKWIIPVPNSLLNRF